MAIYYVDATLGKDTYNGTTIVINDGANEGPWKTFNKVRTTIAANDVIYFKRGETWAGANEYLTFPLNGGNTIDAYGTGAKPILDMVGVAQHAIFSNRANTSIKNIVIKNTEAAKIGIYFSLMDAPYLEGVDVVDCTRPVLFDRTTNISGKNNTIQGMKSNVSLEFSGACTGALGYTIIKGSVNNPASRIYAYNGAVDVTLNNLVQTGINVGNGVDIALGAKLTFNNSYLDGQNVSYIIANLGTCILNNSYAGAAWSTGERFSGDVTENNPLNPAVVIPVPQFEQHSREGIVSLCVDDGGSLDYATSVAAILASYGLKLTFGADQVGVAAVAGYQAKLQALVAAGHEIACHSYSHSAMNQLGAINIAKAGETLTIAITRTDPLDSSTWTGALTTSGGQNINLATAPNNTIAGLVATLAAAGYTCTKIQGASYGTNAKSLCLADVTGQSINVNYAAQMDATAFYQVEVAEAKSWIENVIGSSYVVKTFAYPGSVNDAGSRAAVKAAGYLIGRGDNTGTANTFNLNNLSIFNTRVLGNAIIGDGAQGTLRRLFASWSAVGCERGFIAAFVAHNTTELSLVQWGYVAETLSRAPVRTMTCRSAADYIRASGLWATADDSVTWTRTFTDQSDFHLQFGSPCINAGVDVGLTLDYSGVPVPVGAAPDIGAHEWQPPTERLMPILHHFFPRFGR